MKIIFAQFLGKKVPYFKGKNAIIRFLYPPNKFKNIHKGEKFIIDYYDKKYQGITSNFIDWGVYFYDGLESGFVNYIKTEIKNFNYFLDIGSNSGTISLPFVNENNLKIICFEPLKYNYKKLIKNFELNDGIKNNDFHNIALSDKSGESYIYFSENDENIGTASLDDNGDNKDEKEKIKIEKLDTLYNFKNENIFIKIDVEGHENKVIDGAIDILKNNKILMYIETKNQELLAYLKQLNFEISFPYWREKKFKFVSKQHSAHVLAKNFKD